jgi:hypothetical protein
MTNTAFSYKERKNVSFRTVKRWNLLGGHKMRLAMLALAGALGLGVAAASAQAAPIFRAVDNGQSAGIVKVWGGCGPSFRPVPGHWSRWRGGWAPRHCVPTRRYYGYYGGGYYPYWRGPRSWYGY